MIQFFYFFSYSGLPISLKSSLKVLGKTHQQSFSVLWKSNFMTAHTITVYKNWQNSGGHHSLGWSTRITKHVNIKKIKHCEIAISKQYPEEE